MAMLVKVKKKCLGHRIFVAMNRFIFRVKKSYRETTENQFLLISLYNRAAKNHNTSIAPFMSCLFRLAAFSCNYLLHTACLFVLFGVFITRSMSGVTEKATKQKKRLPKRDRTVKSTWTDGEKQDLIINVEHGEVI